MPNNLLSEQGLGGPWELAGVKASLTLASTVYPKAQNSILLFVREFLKGVWGKLLARSFPHKIFIS